LEAAWFDKLSSFLSSAPILVLLLAKDEVVALWRDLIGPTSTKRAKENKPNSIRALFGTDNLMNAVFGSATVENAKTEIDFFFNSSGNQSGSVYEMDFAEKDLEAVGVSSQKTIVLLMPDICSATGGGGEGPTGSSKAVEAIIERILWSNFQIIKREEMFLQNEQAQELFYRYAEEPWYEELVSFVSNGQCLALVLRGEDVIKSMNDICGPNNPEEANRVSPMRYVIS
jgi:nucleoside diphosphate kinase